MESKDVVIVGGGIVGVSTAYFLAKRGVKSLVIERDAIGSHASGFAYGGLSTISGAGIPGPSFDLASEAMRLYSRFTEELPQESGIDFDYRVRPTVKLAFSDDEVAEAKALLSWQQSQPGHDVRWVDSDGLAELDPRISPQAQGGTYVENTGDLEPYKLVTALAQAAERSGATIRHGSVDGIEATGGRVTAVTVGGDAFPCDAVVIANGPWSSEASKWLGFPVPVSALKGQILRMDAPGPPLECSITWGKHYATTKTDGLVWTGTTEEEAGFDESTTQEARESITSSFLTMLPAMTEAKVVQQTACLRPVVPDHLPIVGAVPGVAGAFLATGAGRKGILLGPPMGNAVADLIVTGQTDVPIEDLSPTRFAEQKATYPGA